MANEIAGVGAKFYQWVTAAWVERCNIMSISGPSKAKDTYETTDLCATDNYRTFIAGLKDGGEVTLSLNYETDIYDALDADFESEANNNYGIALPDPATNGAWEFNGVLTAISNEIPFDGLVTFEVTIKISGKPEKLADWPPVP